MWSLDAFSECLNVNLNNDKSANQKILYFFSDILSFPDKEKVAVYGLEYDKDYKSLEMEIKLINTDVEDLNLKIQRLKIEIKI